MKTGRLIDKVWDMGVIYTCGRESYSSLLRNGYWAVEEAFLQ